MPQDKSGIKVISQKAFRELCIKTFDEYLDKHCKGADGIRHAITASLMLSEFSAHLEYNLFDREVK